MGAANDFGVFVRYRAATPDGSFRVKPYFTAMSRLDETLAVQRYLYYFKVDFERKLVDHWSLIVTPRMRFYDYTASQSGRHDLVYSVSTGLRRGISENLDFTTTVGYENRMSNLPGKGYNDWRVEASLDFSFTLLRSKEGGASSDFLQWLSH